MTCSIIFHRWIFLYTQIPQLTIFSPCLLSNEEKEEEVRFKCFRVDLFANAILENIISNILLMHSSDLKAFHLYNDCKFSYQNVWKWFHLLVSQTLSSCINNFCLTSMRKIAFSFILKLYIYRYMFLLYINFVYLYIRYINLVHRFIYK